MSEHVWYREDGTPHLDALGRPIKRSDDLASCPVCGEYLVDGCEHTVKPEPEHLPRVNRWGVDPEAPTLPPDPHRPF
jgi:hypothetical protein